jgi:hypothetical protein
MLKPFKGESCSVRVSVEKWEAKGCHPRFEEITALQIFAGPARQFQLRELKDLSPDEHDVTDDVRGLMTTYTESQDFRFKFRREEKQEPKPSNIFWFIR